MSFLSTIFSWISDLFESIWGFIKRALPYVLTAIALYFSMGALAPTFMTGLGLTSAVTGGWAAAALALGASFVLAPEETAALYSGAVDSVGTVLSEVGQVAGDVISSTVGSFFSSGIGLWLLLGAGAYLLLSQDKKQTANSDNPVRLKDPRDAAMSRSQPSSPTATQLNEGVV